MRLWVRSEYVDELAVLLSIIAALLPWSVEYTDFGSLGSLLFVRFPLFQVRYNFGVPFFEAVSVLDPYTSLSGRGTTDIFAALGGEGIAMATAYAIWIIGAGLTLVCLGIAAGLYFEWSPVTSRPAASAIAVLLFAAGTVFTAAIVQLYVGGFPGPKVPIGGPAAMLFGVILWRSERV